MNRRGFIGSLAALAAVPVVSVTAARPSAPKPLPMLLADDTAYWMNRIRAMHREHIGREPSDKEIVHWLMVGTYTA